MKKKTLVLTLLALLTGCSNKVSESFTSTGLEVSEKESTSEIEELEHNTIVDKISLSYVSELDSYKKSDWKGKWIWIDNSNKDIFVAFRKTFTLSSIPTSAIASLACCDKGYLYVNGKLVVVDAPSKAGMTTVDLYYQNYDLKEYLKVGENVLTFVINYIGSSSKSQRENVQGGLLFELPLGDQTIVSDSSFKAKLLQEYENKETLGDNYPNYEDNSKFVSEKNVYYNSTKSVGDFTLEDFDDSSWESAKLMGYPNEEPYNDTYLDIAVPFGFSDVISCEDTNNYLNIKFSEDTTVTFSLPYNMQYMPYIELESDADNKQITLYSNTYMSDSASFKDDYIAKKGSQVYQQLAWRTGYQIILEVPAGVTLTKVGYRETFYNSEKVGKFTSSDTFLDTLYTKSLNTLKICMRDTYMDCPDRERSPYSGDGANQITETLYSLDENGIKLAKKTLVSLLGWMDSNDTVKGTDSRIMPSRWPGDDTKEIPIQNLAFIAMVREYLLVTGDSETVSKIYPIFRNYLEVWNMQSDGLIEYRQGRFPWVDWGIKIDSTPLQNEFYYYALDAMKDIASLLNKEEDSFYTTRMNSIKNAFDSFYTEDGYKDSYLDDRTNAMAVVTGLAKEEYYPTITKVLSENYNASPYMERYVQEALLKMNQSDALLNRIHSRYKNMVESETSTLWEKWVQKDGTINHGWTGGTIITLARDFAGIKATSMGYKDYRIKPIYSSLTEYDCVVPTKEGNIELKMNKEEDTTTFTITTISKNGTLYLPKAYGENVTITGDSYTKLNDEDDYYVYSITGSNYSVEIK